MQYASTSLVKRRCEGSSCMYVNDLRASPMLYTIYAYVQRNTQSSIQHNNETPTIHINKQKQHTDKHSFSMTSNI
jgi:hypothetical protein